MADEGKLQLIPLGGLGEIGKNMTAVKYGNNILVIDAGLTFPEDELLGIDVVIPDITYLLENKKLIKGIVLTHGHEDHIGALPYVLKDLNVPVYGTRLTLGLLRQKLKESTISADKIKLNCIKPRDTIKVGTFKVDFFRVSHSIADAVGIAVHTPIGTIVHSGDFKFDQTPVDGDVTDFAKLSELGENGVLVLMSDSTNVERPGYTMSERNVGNTFDEIFRQAKERIVVASFASNIPRIQQVITTAHNYKRKVAIVGRSMLNVVSVASELGYLDVPDGTIVELDEINRLPKQNTVIISTGSQGEPMSALTRMARSEHKGVEIMSGDTVVISATPIPGNEKMVARTVDQLFKLGADVIHEAVSGIHVSGHASQEELKLMLNLVKPKFFVPVHGEYRMLVKHSNLAQDLGIPSENIFVGENGLILEFSKKRGRIAGRVASGRVLVDGLGVGDVGNIVLRDRKQLSQDGILIVVLTLDKNKGAVVAGPDIVSRGFVYVRESEELLEEAKERVSQALEKCCSKNNAADWSAIKYSVRDTLGKFLFEKTHRRPMILPIIMEV
ncbi:ribonuclease J [Metallumcola ferriviriculae]|uniref:Ribonuclease J n=1 Tax=Metallumcola ferriviriculae TaxID=3039180 RepID=A0AAU0UQ51_9FIRM|nr:ribonuclease J [Desulfitibacteraceae bacterium MK1]